MKEVDYLTGDEATQLALNEVTIVGEPSYRTLTTPDGKTREVLVARIRLPNGSERNWAMNKTTIRAISRVYGQETKLWDGKSVKLQIREEKVMGKDKRVIYGTGEVTKTEKVG